MLRYCVDPFPAVPRFSQGSHQGPSHEHISTQAGGWQPCWAPGGGLAGRQEWAVAAAGAGAPPPAPHKSGTSGGTRQVYPHTGLLKFLSALLILSSSPPDFAISPLSPSWSVGRPVTRQGRGQWELGLVWGWRRGEVGMTPNLRQKGVRERQQNRCFLLWSCPHLTGPLHHW